MEIRKRWQFGIYKILKLERYFRDNWRKMVSPSFPKTVQTISDNMSSWFREPRHLSLPKSNVSSTKILTLFKKIDFDLVLFIFPYVLISCSPFLLAILASEKKIDEDTFAYRRIHSKLNIATVEFLGSFLRLVSVRLILFLMHEIELDKRIFCPCHKSGASFAND